MISTPDLYDKLCFSAALKWKNLFEGALLKIAPGNYLFFKVKLSSILFPCGTWICIAVPWYIFYHFFVKNGTRADQNARYERYTKTLYRQLLTKHSTLLYVWVSLWQLRNDREGRIGDAEDQRHPHEEVLCFPLYTIAKAAGFEQIDYFSLDVEGSELDVLETIPFDKLKIQVTLLVYLALHVQYVKKLISVAKAPETPFFLPTALFVKPVRCFENIDFVTHLRSFWQLLDTNFDNFQSITFLTEGTC